MALVSGNNWNIQTVEWGNPVSTSGAIRVSSSLTVINYFSTNAFFSPAVSFFKYLMVRYGEANAHSGNAQCVVAVSGGH